MTVVWELNPAYFGQHGTFVIATKITLNASAIRVSGRRSYLSTHRDFPYSWGQSKKTAVKKANNIKHLTLCPLRCLVTSTLARPAEFRNVWLRVRLT